MYNKKCMISATIFLCSLTFLNGTTNTTVENPRICINVLLAELQPTSFLALDTVDEQLNDLVSLAFNSAGLSLVTLYQEYSGITELFDAIKAISDASIIYNTGIITPSTTLATVSFNSVWQDGQGTKLIINVLPTLNTDESVSMDLEVSFSDFTKTTRFSRILKASTTLNKHEIAVLGGGSNCLVLVDYTVCQNDTNE